LGDEGWSIEGRQVSSSGQPAGVSYGGVLSGPALELSGLGSDRFLDGQAVHHGPPIGNTHAVVVARVVSGDPSPVLESCVVDAYHR
jgi:hypothetical protein